MYVRIRHDFGYQAHTVLRDAIISETLQWIFKIRTSPRDASVSH
jgi:hypothetical protein